MCVEYKFKGLSLIQIQSILVDRSNEIYIYVDTWCQNLTLMLLYCTTVPVFPIVSVSETAVELCFLLCQFVFPLLMNIGFALIQIWSLKSENGCSTHIKTGRKKMFCLLRDTLLKSPRTIVFPKSNPFWGGLGCCLYCLNIYDEKSMFPKPKSCFTASGQSRQTWWESEIRSRAISSWMHLPACASPDSDRHRQEEHHNSQQKHHNHLHHQSHHQHGVGNTSQKSNTTTTVRPMLSVLTMMMGAMAMVSNVSGQNCGYSSCPKWGEGWHFNCDSYRDKIYDW